jgi:hypothetical protein
VLANFRLPVASCAGISWVSCVRRRLRSWNVNHKNPLSVTVGQKYTPIKLKSPLNIAVCQCSINKPSWNEKLKQKSYFESIMRLSYSNRQKKRYRFFNIQT